MGMNHLAFTVDLDDWYHTPLVAGANFSYYKTVHEFFENWNGRYDFITDPTFRLLELLDKYKVKATFFIIADMVERYPEVMKALKNSDHEIAHHSLHHTIPYNTKTKQNIQSKEAWEAELIQAKSILEGYFEQQVVGYRAPGAYFADWMVPILYKHGFRYDSSMVYNSLYNKSNRDLSKFPKIPFWLGTDFEPKGNEQNAILEIPWVSRKIGKWHLPGGGAFFFRLLGCRYFKQMFHQHLKKGDGVFYIHSLDLSDEKFPLSNFSNRPFYWINKGAKTEKALDWLLAQFQGNFVSCGELLQKYLQKG